jgi:hypothetical protein
MSREAARRAVAALLTRPRPAPLHEGGRLRIRRRLAAAAVLDELAAEPVAEREELLAAAALRPCTRGDCTAVPRPCPFVGCRFHLWMEVNGRGELRLARPCRPEELPADRSCALDLADQYPGGLPLATIGALFGLTRERVRQLEQAALHTAHRDRALRQLRPDRRDP